MTMEHYKHEVRYYECDRMGVTHHSNYIRIMEEARIHWLDQLGFGFEKIEAEGVFSPVISVTCEYKHPSTFKDIIDVEVNIAKMSEMKFDFSYVMRVGEKVICKAQSSHCFIENNRPVAISKRLPDFYNALNQIATAATGQ